MPATSLKDSRGPRAILTALAAALIAATAPSSAASTHAGKIALQSTALQAYLAVWNNGGTADIHASASKADGRTELSIEDAGNGFVTLRSLQSGCAWTLANGESGSKVLCAESGEGSRFLWIDNADGSVSFKSEASSLYLSVVEEDSTIVPFIDPSLLAAVERMRTDTAGNPDGGPSLIVTPEMMKPYTVKNQVLRASAPAIGDRERFSATAPAAFLKKSAAEGGATKVLTYLESISGKQTIGGIHNREPNSDPARWTNWVNTQAGKYPGLWSGDFLFESENIAARATMINEAKNQWGKGAAVGLMYHMCTPTGGEVCSFDNGVKGKLTDAQWTQLITNGTALNNTFKQRLDNIAVYIKSLKDAGVEVIFRPFHEMNQGAFWWGGRTGANGTPKLYQIAHDYLVQTKGLDNLVFVWSIQDLSWDFQAYNPGEKYWDIMSMDFYNGDGFTSRKYNAMLDVAGDKLVAIAETAKLPTSAELKTQPRWIYFSGWSELTQSSNTGAAVKAVYTADNTISRDEMPGWASVTPVTSVKDPHQPAFTESDGANAWSSIDAASSLVRFQIPEQGRVRISLHDSQGRMIASLVDGEYGPGLHERSFARPSLKPGVYFVKSTLGGEASFRKIGVMNP